jgi:hypothetical protein
VQLVVMKRAVTVVIAWGLLSLAAAAAAAAAELVAVAVGTGIKTHKPVSTTEKILQTS